MNLLESDPSQSQYTSRYGAYPGSLTEQAGLRLAEKVINLKEGSNPFCVILPAVRVRNQTRTFEELIQLSKEVTPLLPDMSAPVTASFFKGLDTTPGLIEDFCAKHEPPLSLRVYEQYYDQLPADVFEKIKHLDSVPERPICYEFSVLGIEAPQANI